MSELSETVKGVREQIEDGSRGISADAQASNETATKVDSTRAKVEVIRNALSGVSAEIFNLATMVVITARDEADNTRKAAQHHEHLSELAATAEGVTAESENDYARSAQAKLGEANRAASESRSAHLLAKGILMHSVPFPGDMQETIGTVFEQLASLDEKLEQIHERVVAGASESEKAAASSAAAAQDLEEYERSIE